MMASPGLRSRLALPLLGLCAALAAAVYLQAGSELSLPDDPAIAVAPVTPALELGDEPALAMAPIEHFSETVTRPLFMATRRPPEPGAPVVATPEPARSSPLALELSGIVISPRERVALLVRARSGEVIRVSEGELVGNWVVRSIHPDRVILEQEGKRQELRLEDKAPRAPKRRKRQPGQERQVQGRQDQTGRGATSPAEPPPQGELPAGAAPGSVPTGPPRTTPE
jgi:hypothetical protein